MANEEQLSILKQGVDVWNQWRGKNIQGEIDLSGAREQPIYRGLCFLGLISVEPISVILISRNLIQ